MHIGIIYLQRLHIHARTYTCLLLVAILTRSNLPSALALILALRLSNNKLDSTVIVSHFNYVETTVDYCA